MTLRQEEIPTVDLADLASPHADRQERASAALKHAFGEYGLVYVKGHGISEESLDTFYGDFMSLASLPLAEKEKYAKPEIWYQRGWTPPNTEKAVVAGGQPDFKECWFATPEPLDPNCRLQYPQIYCDNIWPEDGGRLQKSMTEIGHALHEIGLTLLRGCARALQLEPYLFESISHGGPHVFRALRYLPLNEEQIGTGILWGEEHTDFNLLTLLPGGRFLDPHGERCAKPDDQCGLYLRTRGTPENPSGRMVPGRAPNNCIVVQVGQQLEILTGGTFLATPHVIKAPTKVGYSRLSAAHFMHLHSHQVLYPLAPFRNESTIRAYSPPVLAGTYSTKTLVDIGLAPQSSLDLLGYRHYDRLEESRAAD